MHNNAAIEEFCNVGGLKGDGHELGIVHGPGPGHPALLHAERGEEEERLPTAHHFHVVHIELAHQRVK